MADVFVPFVRGEKRPVYVYADTSSGTLDITAQPTVQVVADDGTVLVETTNVTGYDVGAAATVRAWYVLDTSGESFADPGDVMVQFNLTVTGSDGIERLLKPYVIVPLE